MKKLLTILFFVVISTTTFSQQLCQAYFTSSYNPASGNLNLYDQSYNFDSTQVNVTTWAWTLQYGGASYTYSTQNPVIPQNGYNGPILVCLTIYTNSLIPCQSSWCDSIYIGNPPPPVGCVADFTYQSDTAHNFTFTDQSYSNNGSIIGWNWVITNTNTGNIVYSSNNFQNPVVNLPVNQYYHVCLTMATDSGCTATTCENVYVNDSMNTGCQLAVSAQINQVSVINGNDGAINLTVTGGTPPYTFIWNTGATTEDISNLSSGIYTVAISTTPACPNYTYSYYVGEPLDSTNIIIDTLYSPVIDTCLNFVVDSFYVAGITVQGNTVIVEWVFYGGGAMATLYATYTYTNFGGQMVVLSVNCGSKSISTYSSYIYINQALGLSENSEADQFNLYPNPVTDMLNISFSFQNHESFSVKIFNSAGQQVLERTIAAHTSQAGINVNELPSGVYFIHLSAASGKPLVKKFLK
ncbi:MAG: T9SS type A sorting domain-containing protein [Bacteroidota bacterium]